MGADQSVIPVEVYNDPKHRRKASTIVVGIIGLVLSMVSGLIRKNITEKIGLIIGFVGLGIGILISIFVLCIFPAFYITSFALLITSLSKRVVTRQITTCVSFIENASINCFSVWFLESWRYVDTLETWHGLLLTFRLIATTRVTPLPISAFTIANTGPNGAQQELLERSE